MLFQLFVASYDTVLNSEMNKFCPIEMGRRTNRNVGWISTTLQNCLWRASSFSDFGGLFLKSLEVNRKLLLSCSQCNVLCNDQHMLVHGQIRGSCQIFIRLSGRAYRARGTVSYLFRKKCDWTLFSHSLRFHHWWNFCVCHTGPYFAIE
jgi:hypothetical protein